MVGEAARLTALLVVLALACGDASARRDDLLVDGACRDGFAHGRYELRSGSGALRVAGAFNHGKRTGSFIFWNGNGTRIAHIPYDDDLRNGTLATWYEPRRRGGEATHRLESPWRRGVRDGLTRSWYPDGHRRLEAEYEGGRLVRATAWSDAGTRLDEAAAHRIAERDAVTGDAEYAELEALVRQHLPRCD